MILIDSATLQGVITKLASEGGLKRIKEVVEQPLQDRSTAAKTLIFTRQMVPLFEIITHPDVLDSLMLETQVAQLYTFLFGIVGARAKPLFRFIADFLNEHYSQCDDFVHYLELSIVSFCKFVDFNTLGSVQPEFAELADQIQQTYIEASEHHDDFKLLVSRNHLERLLRRLEVGILLPVAASSLGGARQTPLTAFVVLAEPPGSRHDNDFEDICKIDILPTAAEITSQRAEYLPGTDPSQWHLSGVEGLLDRNFRLLREDTAGQLRDTIQQVMRSLAKSAVNKGSFTNTLRTRTYEGATVNALSLDKLTGVNIEIQFPQLSHVKRMSFRDRKDWWESSKRLQHDALVCLVDFNGPILFCSVVLLEKRQNVKTQSNSSPAKDFGLWQDSQFVRARLAPVNQDPDMIKEFYAASSKRSDTSSILIVELPGVLLPAFQPILQALQKIKRAGDLPFADLLAPSSLTGYVQVPPPAYATAPAFAWNLSALVTSNAELLLRPGQPFDPSSIVDDSSLDEAQARSLVEALTHQVSLIQGPPGTGKSYTGIALLKVLISNRKRKSSRTDIGPIVCVCYTNHATDQILEGVLDSGVTTQVVRVGSQSKSERLQNHNLRTIARELGKTRQERHDTWELNKEIESLEARFEEAVHKINKSSSGAVVRDHLKAHHFQIYNQLFDEDEDGFQRVGSDNPDRLLKTWLWSSPALADGDQNDRLRSSNIHVLGKKDRHARYRGWIREIEARLEKDISSSIDEFKDARERLNKIQDECDLRCLRNADIIGITTSGLARKIEVLRRVRAKVMICEEAGEVIEPHMLAALLPSLEHLILIGDHLQLRPQVQNHSLSRENPHGGAKYSLDVSLFERLVQPSVDNAIQVPFSTLQIQRRMHPSISKLIRDTLYPSLEDHTDVSDYPPVPGMKSRLFWLNHNSYELDTSGDAVDTSHWNPFEIDMVAAIVAHLAQQGIYKAGEIAVLTPYLGQLHKLRRTLQDSFTLTIDERDQQELIQAGLGEAPQLGRSAPARLTMLQAVRVATIDNFQGEEAKIVIISLVRSNAKRQCGFLKTSNRINVLLSRAKHGMYILGDSETCAHVKMWADVIAILRNDDNFGTELELECPRHLETPMKVSTPDDFARIAPEGGCIQRCVQRLSCGHACTKPCHSELVHSAVFCTEPCQRAMRGCDHPCPKLCGDKCPPKCVVPVEEAERILPCGHLEPVLPCWQAQDLSLVVCQVQVTRTVPRCNHQVQMKCHEDEKDPEYRCLGKCGQALPCGHTCRKACFVCRAFTVENGVQFNHGQCSQECGRSYNACIHSCKRPCHGNDPCRPCTLQCEVRCHHSQCPKTCSEPCTPCAEETCMSACPHSKCTLPCAAPCDHVPCSRRCDWTMECGHQCPSVCGEVCPDTRFCQTCATEEIRTTTVDLLEGIQYSDIDLDQSPCIFPACGHFLTVESMDGVMSISEYYTMSSDGEVSVPIAIKPSSEPFSMKDIKVCSSCRGSLRDLARYGRLVRRAILDESTKKLVTLISQGYVPLANGMQHQLHAIQEIQSQNPPRRPIEKKPVDANQGRDHQVFTMGKLLETRDGKAWRSVKTFRARIMDYHNHVSLSEQPLNRVKEAVDAVRRRTGKGAKFDFDETVLQTKGFILATALVLRLDLAVLSTFIILDEQPGSATTAERTKLDLKNWYQDCENLLAIATQSKQPAQQVEAFILLAQLHAIARSRTQNTSEAAQAKAKGMEYILQARILCANKPGSTRGLSSEIDELEKMFRESTFYSVVSNEERMQVVQAMAAEFSGTGHWYYCEEGHPFTIGECGMPMETARCPECDAPIGGQNHQAEGGVRHARDLEEGFRGLRI